MTLPVHTPSTGFEVEWEEDGYEDARESEWKDRCKATRHRRARRERREAELKRKAALSEA